MLRASKSVVRPVPRPVASSFLHDAHIWTLGEGTIHFRVHQGVSVRGYPHRLPRVSRESAVNGHASVAGGYGVEAASPRIILQMAGRE